MKSYVNAHIDIALTSQEASAIGTILNDVDPAQYTKESSTMFINFRGALLKFNAMMDKQLMDELEARKLQ